MTGQRVKRGLWGAVLGGSILCAGAPAARAEDTPERPPTPGATLADAAAGRARQGERRVAIDLYDEAYRATPRNDYLREIGNLYDALSLAGDSRDVRLAILYFERYLAGEGPTPGRADVEQRLTRLRGWKAKMRSEPQPPPPPASVPVHLLAYEGKEPYEVGMGPTGCTTPCTLLVAPGPTKLKARGPGDVALDVVVPPRASQIRLRHSDSASVTVGAVLLPSGIVTGAAMWAVALACPNNGNDNGACVTANLVVWPIIGLAATVTGIVLLARGRSTPPPDANRVELVGKRAPPLQVTGFGLGPVPGSGGGTAGVTLAF